MDRRSFIHTTALVSAAGISPRAMGATPKESRKVETQSESRRRIELAIRAAMSMQRRDWEQGILAEALLEAGKREQLILLTKAAMVQQTPDGRMGVVVSGGPTDPAMGGAAYAKAAEWTGEAAMKRAVDAMLQWIRSKAPRNAEGILYHTFDGPEFWSDGMNGAPPFLAAMGLYDEALKQIDGYRKRLWNPEKELMAHIWEDGEQRLKDPNLWGGGNGWAAAGLARVIRSLPAQRKADRERLAGYARELIDGCLRYQRTDGLFHNVVNQPETFVETNLAQMLAYAMYSGMTEGWLTASYREPADRLRRGAREKMDAFGFVQGACGAPDFERPGNSTEAQAFCILMEAAGEQFN